MTAYKFITCPGIGDFSWLWTKLSTTNDSYLIEYAVTGPERLSAFLALLPKEKILGYRPNTNHRVNFNTAKLEMNLVPSDIHRLKYYRQFQESSNYMFYVEANTHLEQGNRIEKWLPELKTNFHYKINGVLDNPEKENIFVVHLSSKRMQNIWNCYGLQEVIEIIDMVQKKTGWTPVFMGAEYDDFAQEVFAHYNVNHTARSVIGETPDLLSALHVIQKSKFFLGCVSSGMTMLANVLYVPLAAWWPREKLPQSWADESIPYKWFLWKDHKKDMIEIEKMLEVL